MLSCCWRPFATARVCSVQRVLVREAHRTAVLAWWTGSISVAGNLIFTAYQEGFARERSSLQLVDCVFQLSALLQRKKATQHGCQKRVERRADCCSAGQVAMAIQRTGYCARRSQPAISTQTTELKCHASMLPISELAWLRWKLHFKTLQDASAQDLDPGQAENCE